MHFEKSEEVFRAELAVIRRSLPLAIPLFDGYQFFAVPNNRRQRYMTRCGLAMLLESTGYTSDGHEGYYLFRTDLGLLTIGNQERYPDLYFHMFLQDWPRKVIVPFQTVLTLAQSIPAILWLFKIKSFWNHPLVERQLVAVIKSF